MGWTAGWNGKKQIAARARFDRRSKTIAMIRGGGFDEEHGKHRRGSVLSVGRTVDNRVGASCAWVRDDRGGACRELRWRDEGHHRRGDQRHRPHGRHPVGMPAETSAALNEAGAAPPTCAGWALSTISTVRAAIGIASCIASANGLLRNAVRSPILDRQHGRENDHERAIQQ